MINIPKKYQKTKAQYSYKKQNTFSQKKTKNFIKSNNIGTISIYAISENNMNQKCCKKEFFDKSPNTPDFIFNKYNHTNNFTNKTKSYSKPISPKNEHRKLLSDSTGKKDKDNNKIDIKQFLPKPKSLFKSNDKKDKNNYYNKYININNNNIDNISLTNSRNKRVNNNNNKNDEKKNKNNIDLNKNKKKNNIKQCILNNLNKKKINNNNKFNIVTKNINNINNSNNDSLSFSNCVNHTILYKKNDCNSNDLIENSTNYNTINNEHHNTNNISNYNSIDNNSIYKKRISHIENHPSNIQSITDLYNISKVNHNNSEMHNISQIKNKINDKSENKQQLNSKIGIKDNNFHYAANNHKCFCTSCCCKSAKNNNIFIVKFNKEKYSETRKNMKKLYYEKNCGIIDDKDQCSINDKKYQKNQKILNKTPNKSNETENLKIKNRAKSISHDFLSKKDNNKYRGIQNLSYIEKENNKSVINNNRYKNITMISKYINNKRETNIIQEKNNNPHNLSMNNTLLNKFPNKPKIKMIPSFNSINPINNNNPKKLKIINNRMKNRIKIKLFFKKPRLNLKIRRRKTIELDLLTKKIKKECDICHKIIDSHLFKIHYNSHPSKIFNWLYLGSFANARDITELKFNGINKILNCAIECHNTQIPKDIEEMHLYIKDAGKFNIFDYFEKANDYINKCKLEGGKLLVHCKFGISRSASFVIAYLIKYDKYTVDNALRFLQKKRNQINPNQGFMNQLYQYEQYLKNKKI